MWPDTKLCELFDVKYPIILSPMAGSAGPALAIAVCEAGGVGSLPCASLTLDEIAEHFTTVRQSTTKPLSLNFFCHEFREYEASREQAWLDRFSPYGAELGLEPTLDGDASNLEPFGEEHCRLVEELRPTIASFHFGLPTGDLVQRVKAAGCRVISSANTVAEARWLESRGCDAVIAQGTEAGGHRGMFLSQTVTEQAGTFALVPQIADAIDVPVIAAGGVGDGRGIAAAFALGASAVQMGTAYLFTDESLASALYRERLNNASDNGTVLTNVFSGRPARGFANRVTHDLGPITEQPMDFPMGYGVLAQFKQKAEASGSTEFSSCLSGQSASLGRAETAAQLTERLVNEAEKIFSNLSA